MIKFLLNQEPRVEEFLDPNMTVLNYLRTRAGKTATKEGCASGDCGACTVVIAELDGNRLHYKSINSCLTFIASLHGKQLISVEDLKDHHSLHPAQQAMVDCHGSQCGFCTPGFVMSMFALGKNRDTASKQDIQEALAGNLCRCTGYRPIIDAAHAMYDRSMYDQSKHHNNEHNKTESRKTKYHSSINNRAIADQFDRHQQQTIEALRALQIDAQPQLSEGQKRAYNPTTITELAELFNNHDDARLVAGGTDIALEVTQFHRQIDTLIHIGDIADLNQVQVFDDRIELGAAASLTDCYQALSSDYPDFGALLHRFASLQIRNQGTLGGNIGNASPIADCPPALISLNAQVVLTKVLRQGLSSRTIDLEEYFIDYKVTALQPSEFIEKVIVPRAHSNGEFRSYKLSKRIDDDISAVLGCFNLKIDNNLIQSARVAFGGMAAIPKRASHCEEALAGSPWNLETIERAKQALMLDYDPISDFRASREYRRLTARNLLSRYFVELNSPEVESRVTDYA